MPITLKAEVHNIGTSTSWAADSTPEAPKKVGTVSVGLSIDPKDEVNANAFPVKGAVAPMLSLTGLNADLLTGIAHGSVVTITIDVVEG